MKTIGHKVFKDGKAANLFVEYVSTLVGDRKVKFSEKVFKLFDDKITGDGTEFYITTADIIKIAKTI